MSEETQNKYKTQFLSKNSPGVPFTATELLHLMRPDVEEILTLMGLTSPPSQSNRAREALGMVKIKIQHHSDKKNDVTCQETWFNQFRQLLNARRTLEAFLSVHKTVGILEGNTLS